jgi:gluconokinase
MKSRQSFVMMGVAGSGKSYVGQALADALHVTFVEGDAFHSDASKERMRQGIPLTDADRAPWLAVLAGQLRIARERGTSVVMSCSALRRSYRDRLRSGDPDVQFVWLRTPPDTLRERLTAREGHYMPSSLLESQLATLEVPGTDERVWIIEATVPLPDIIDQLCVRVHDARAS